MHLVADDERDRRARAVPLVGRERELEIALAAIEADGGVVVAGPPGIGKSRLAREAAVRSAAGSPVTHIVATAAAATVPFAAVVQLLPPGAGRSLDACSATPPRSWPGVAVWSWSTTRICSNRRARRSSTIWWRPAPWTSC